MEKKELQTSNTDEMITISRAEYEADKAYIAELEQQTRWLMEQMNLLKQQRFGSGAEKASEEVIEQLNLLFDEAEVYAYTEQKTAVKSHTRKKSSGSIRDVVPEDVPVEEIIHELPADQRVCPQCGEELIVIGKEVHESLKIKPAEAILQRDIYYTYACGNCE